MINKCNDCGNVWAGNRNEQCPKCGGNNYAEYDPSIEDLKEAAEQGDAEAQFELGILSIHAEPIWYSPWDNDPSGPTWFYAFFKNKDSLDRFLKAAEQGHAAAQYELGETYYNGNNEEGDLDYDEAFKWFSKAAAQGHIAAQFYLGQCYKEGCGTEKNYDEAIKWFSKAAESKYSAALCGLGKCYEEGVGVERNCEEAVKLYRQAAEFDDAARYELGRCYLDGIGVRKNPYEALWWITVASFGNKDASDAREEIHNSDCLKEFDEELDDVHDTLEDAEDGDADSQYWMGCFFEYGAFVDDEEDAFDTIDLAEAEYWYGQAAEQGHEDAIEALKRFKK